MKAQLENTVELSRTITRSYYEGDMEPYLSHLCSKSIWLGTGGRVLIGGDAIRSRLRSVARKKACRSYEEDYHALPISSRCEAVTAQVKVGEPDQGQGDILACYTFLYQLIGSETKLVLLHASYEFLRPFALKEDGPKLELSAYQFVRDILLEIPPKERLAIPSGRKTLFVQPHMVFYVQSKRRKAEFFCVDKVIQSDLSINEANAMLPKEFCSIHRCYTVNTRYVMSIERYEVSLITGETLPVPFHSYMQVKADLESRITGEAGPS